jgi:hypothetical protein
MDVWREERGGGRYPRGRSWSIDREETLERRFLRVLNAALWGSSIRRP